MAGSGKRLVFAWDHLVFAWDCSEDVLTRPRRRRSENPPPREGVDFGPFRLTLTPLQLWRGQKLTPLQPRPLAVLRYFVEHPDTVISNEALRQVVWGRTVVSSTTVQVCVREVRKALGEEGRSPRYIETVGRDGYRFIGQIVSGQQGENQKSKGKNQKAKIGSLFLAPNTQHLAPNLVGRDAELAHLHTLLEKAVRGERQLVFITGEAGIGKTALIDAFLSGIRDWGLGVGREEKKDWRREDSYPSESKFQRPIPNPQPPTPSLWLGRGQCLEQYGEGEAYLPVLEAVGQLCQHPDGGDFVAVLRRYAPTWLLHFPGIVGPEEWEALQRRGAAPRSQMLREMADVLEAVSAEQTVILVLEDLHVSDPSTVELLTYLAQRRARARLFIIGSYRPVNIILSDHPLRARVHELLARGYGQTIALELLTEMEVAAYLRQRLTMAPLPPTLAHWVFQRTDGNALFVVSMVEYLLEQQRLMLAEGQWQLDGDLTADVVPDTLQRLILAQFDSLPPEQQRVLEVASVAGAVFIVTSVAAGLQSLPEVVEEVCEHLVRHGQFIKELGLATWPNGTVSSQYGFGHALYPEVLYRRMSAGRRVRMHLALGGCEEAGYGERASERAAELARHFAEGHDFSRAVRYLVQAGQNALHWSAYVEALSHFSQGLTLLATQPMTPERMQQELWLQTGVVIAQSAIRGVVPEVEQALLRAHALCQEIGETSELVPVLIGLWAFYFARGEQRTARQLAEQAFRLAHDTREATLLGVAQANLQTTLYFQGELAAARVNGERALTQFASSPPLPLVFNYGVDPEARARGYAAAILQALGYADRAREQSRAALALAQELAQIFTTVTILNFVANLCGAYGEWSVMQARATELIDLALAHNLPFWWASGMCSQGIALTQQGSNAEGIGQIQQGLAVHRAAGATVAIARTLGWLAEAYGQMGQINEAFQVLEEAFAAVKESDERIWEAELYRRKGELLLNAEFRMMNNEQKTKTQENESAFLHRSSFSVPHSEEAEACFLKAIEIARQQQAKFWELRATMSLARLWQRQGKTHAAWNTLSEIYNWFTEGFDTADLQEARALLETLRHK